MAVAAVICEYNPFHYGHAYQFSKIREMLGQETVILSLMSASTVQRGEVAIASKFQRAAAAVTAGADLVLELPYPYCSSVAEHFAMGAVSILSALGVVNYIVFGTESGDISTLQKHALRRQSVEFATLFSQMRKEHKNFSYPMLVVQCYDQLYSEPFPKGSNDILGIYYLTALAKLNSPIIPITHLRLPNASATSARNAAKSGNLSQIPENLRGFFGSTAALDKAERAILGVLRTHSDPKIRHAASNVTSYAELVAALADRNNTFARIRRDILHILLGYNERDFSLPKFTTVLAMNKKGSELLRAAKKTSKIPIITKPSSYKTIPYITEQFELNLCADKLFALCCDEILPAGWSLRESPFVKK